MGSDVAKGQFLVFKACPLVAEDQRRGPRFFPQPERQAAAVHGYRFAAVSPAAGNPHCQGQIRQGRGQGIEKFGFLPYIRRMNRPGPD